MSDAVLSLVSVAVGAAIAGLIGFVLADRQAKFLRDERQAAENERAMVRLEEALRDERRDRVRGVREGLDVIARFSAVKSQSDYDAVFVSKSLGKPLLEVQNKFRVTRQYQTELLEMLKAINVAHARSPESIARKLVDLVSLDSAKARYNQSDEKANSAFLMKAAAVHEAIEEYISTGLVDGKSPNLSVQERELEVQKFWSVIQSLQEEQSEALDLSDPSQNPA